MCTYVALQHLGLSSDIRGKLLAVIYWLFAHSFRLPHTLPGERQLVWDQQPRHWTLINTHLRTSFTTLSTHARVGAHVRVGVDPAGGPLASSQAGRVGLTDRTLTVDDVHP